MTMVNWGLMDDYQEVSCGINGFETSLDECTHAKLKGVFNENYCEKFENKFPETLEDVSDKIEKGKLKLKEMRLLHEENILKSEEERMHTEQEKKNDTQKRFEFKQEQINAMCKIYTKNLYKEILLLSK